MYHVNHTFTNLSTIIFCFIKDIERFNSPAAFLKLILQTLTCFFLVVSVKVQIITTQPTIINLLEMIQQFVLQLFTVILK